LAVLVGGEESEENAKVVIRNQGGAWYVRSVLWTDCKIFDELAVESDTFDCGQMPFPPEAQPEVDADIVTFAGEKLGFVAEPSQLEFLPVRGQAGNCELLPAVWEVDARGVEGDLSGLDSAGVFGAGGESDVAAEWIVFGEGEWVDCSDGLAGEAGQVSSAELAISEWVADCGIACL